uniref:Reverse transcriptase Ty1/copia-type domain-containing protein n=1 Tax=Brassica oleracea var. oleracea TaxID=109376 RepID=A0A0D2ZRS5_BRAOL
MVGYALQVAEEVDVSSTYMKAVSSLESEKRHVATRDMKSHQKNHTWDLVTLPSGRRDVTYKWVFKIKVEASSAERVKYKARIVARGFSQREGVDYNEMFSLVVRDTFIRVLLALVVRQDLELKQFDVKTVFFHGELEEIYMTQPDGYRVPEKDDYVCTLQKSLCGFKQSLRGWYKRFSSYIIKLGYIRSPYDWCVYVSKLKDATFIYLVLYVDDMLI